MQQGCQRPVMLRNSERREGEGSALPRLEAALDLVDHVNAALATDQAVGAVPATQRFQRITDLHGSILMLWKGRVREARHCKNEILPAGGHAARDARLLSHQRAKCQSVPPRPAAPHG